MQLHLSRRLNVPILKYFESLTDEHLIEMSKITSGEFLTYLSENNMQAHIESSLKKWVTNQLPLVSKDQVVGEDITLISYIRKQAFLKLLPQYTSDINQALEITSEIDDYLLESESAFFKTYINLQQEKINEHLHFIEKITHTSPSIIYVYDEMEQKEIYSNQRTEEFVGYTREDLKQFHKSFAAHLIHPDDMERIKEHSKKLYKSKDGEICAVECRVKDKNNNYRWLRAYESVFKRNTDGTVWQKIGTAIDIHNERLIAEQLQRSEHQLLEAQELAEMGSFEWNFVTHDVNVTPQLKKIFELKELGDMRGFMNNVHPTDRSKVQQAIDKAINENGVYECEYRYNANGKEKTIWSKGMIFKENGHSVMRGTIMDVTERHHMIQQLQRSDELHKQAQALTHIGNYTVDLRTNELKWSEELYRIYELEEGEKITYEEAYNLRHPEDTKALDDLIKKSIETLQPFDVMYRIITKNGTVKILHSKGEVLADEKSKAYKLIGTVQDITEKQSLIEKLQRTENLYKQTEALANMGNWRWDIATDKIEWTDELYRIYDLEPQSEEVTLNTFRSFIHPDDKAFVEEGLKKAFEDLSQDFTFRIITKKGKEKIIRSIAKIHVNQQGRPVFAIGTEQDITEKQNLIKELQKSNELSRQAQAIAHVGNWTWNVGENKVDWTDEVYRIYGLQPQSEEITYERYISLIYPDDVELVTKHVKDCLQSYKPYEFYHRILPPGSPVKIVQSKGEVVLNAESKPVQLFGTVQDVTAQQQTEQQLRENQVFIQKIADATPSVISSYNINTGKYTFINQGLEKLLGYDPQEALDKGIAFVVDKIHPDDFEPLMKKNNEALEKANNAGENEADLVSEFQYRMRHKDGRYRWFHTYGTIFDRNEEGKVEHILNISLDITDTVEAEQKVKEQEYFIKHIADASPTVLYLFQAIEGKVLYINNEVYSILGYMPEEIINMGSSVISALYHPEDALKISERLHAYKHSKKSDTLFQFECRMKHKNGGWHWLLIREIVFRHNEEGQIAEILGSALDITERKKTDHILFQKTLELQQSNASLEEFAYVASHDLKEPLRKITSFTDRLKSVQKDALSNEGKTYLEKITESSKRMQQLIDDLLSVSMISTEKTFEPYSLQKILNEVMQTLEFKIEELDAIINAPELPEANIIPSQFRQLFQNLLSNSLKFSKPGVKAEITISYSYLKPKEVQKYELLASAARYLKLNFADNGIGFEQKYADKIFVIFQRLHNRNEYEGTGIGLAICKKIVENHGGVIYAKAKPGAGCSFTIIIPA